MKVTYLGHSCFAVEVGGKHLLIDPFISGNPNAKQIDATTIAADYILITHGHSDHVGDAEAIAKRTGATIISNYEIAKWFEKKGLKVVDLNFGGIKQFDFGKVKLVNAIHSSTLPDGSNGGNPGGFVVETDEGNFYHAGDTALCSDMSLIPHRHPLQFAMLPIGSHYTMDAIDAAAASQLLQCKQIIGIHYDTFPPIKIDHVQAKQAFENFGSILHLMKIGESKIF